MSPVNLAGRLGGRARAARSVSRDFEWCRDLLCVPFLSSVQSVPVCDGRRDCSGGVSRVTALPRSHAEARDELGAGEHEVSPDVGYLTEHRPTLDDQVRPS
jgi:hypothetical protein